MRGTLVALSAVLVGAACSGAAEARVANLETRVTQLSRGGGSGGDSATADNDRMSAIENQLSVLQRELANTQASRPAEPAAASATPAAPRPVAGSRDLDSIAWLSADAVLGVDPGGVSVNGDSYVVQRAWLARELSALQIPGRAPKLAAAPGGVVIRSIKPKSLAAQLGLQNADVLVAIDDHPVASPADVSSALHAARGGQTKVKVLRKKKEVQLDYKLVD
jgi:membrane-associated protease RseP (regulator of RpoE activity)